MSILEAKTLSKVNGMALLGNDEILVDLYCSAHAIKISLIRNCSRRKKLHADLSVGIT